MSRRERYVGWRKSSYSGTGNNCVEVGPAESRAVIGVRDTASGDGGPVLMFEVLAWRAFLTEIKDGEHSLS